MKIIRSTRIFLHLIMLTLVTTLWPAAAFAETSSNDIAAKLSALNWVEGSGQTIEMGDGLAELKLNEGFLFLNSTDARSYQTITGGMPSNKEIGVVFPEDENQLWAVYFEYEETGHISEKEKDKIDAKKLLKSYQDGTEESNKSLSEENRLYVDGWDTPPFYDEKTHNLSWSLLARDGMGNKLINYNSRILTRVGVISVILVSDPDNLEADRKVMEEQVLSAFSLKEGHRYDDFDPSTDKKAEYGLSGLILGGAGVMAAKKLGLLSALLLFLKKFWIVVIAGIGALWGLFKRFLGKKETAEEAGGSSSADASLDPNSDQREDRPL